jgi:hypothetical protein
MNCCPGETAKRELTVCPVDHAWGLVTSLVSNGNDLAVSTFLSNGGPARLSGPISRQDFLHNSPPGGAGFTHPPSEPFYILNLSFLI